MNVRTENSIPPIGLGERIRECIEKSNRTVVETAKILHVSRSRLYDMMNGVHAPNATILARMCKTFNVAADYLLFGGRWSS